MESTEVVAKRAYAAPSLTDLGSVAKLTLGSGGSTLDGGGDYTQRGQGNDSDDPTPPNP